MLDFAAALRRVGYSFSVALAPKISQEQSGLLYTAHDYGAVGSIADKVIIMTYEWGYTYGEPMAVAPIDKVRQVLDYAVMEMPPEKILMGMANYGYSWTLPYKKGLPRGRCPCLRYRKPHIANTPIYALTIRHNRLSSGITTAPERNISPGLRIRAA